MSGIQKYTVLRNGVKMPTLGFGTSLLANDEGPVSDILVCALKTGYRMIDTASLYGTEEAVGVAVRESGIPRGDVFITTKVWLSQMGYGETHRAFDKSLEKLRMDYVDLYMLHWPAKESFLGTWKAIEEIYASGRARAIGVCNCHPKHLAEIMAHAEIQPMVNQVERHPYLKQEDVKDFCNANGIVLISYCPLCVGEVYSDGTINEIAKESGKTPTQVVLRWQLQSGFIPIPKSSHPSRIKENYEIWDFSLSEEQMQRLDSIQKVIRKSGNPDIEPYEFPGLEKVFDLEAL